jgi:hypothetical protein
LKARRQHLIAKHKPWLKSTGPTSFLGKKIVSQNALKHGLRSTRCFSEEERRSFTTLMRRLRRNGLI